MIYIASAFISLFITSVLIIALVWCNYQYKRLTKSTAEFMKTIIKSMDERKDLHE